MADEEIIAELTRVKGIGRWTGEMFLMFNLHRPDVHPIGDLGLRNAVEKAYELPKGLTVKELSLMGERWRPYRSAATWYFWQSTRLVTTGDAAAIRAPKSSKTKPLRKRVPRKSAPVGEIKRVARAARQPAH
jgi:DNA-3-methyladenine glycosylase II